jgi:hypothetical protein
MAPGGRGLVGYATLHPPYGTIIYPSHWKTGSSYLHGAQFTVNPARREYLDTVFRRYGGGKRGDTWGTGALVGYATLHPPYGTTGLLFTHPVVGRTNKNGIQ